VYRGRDFTPFAYILLGSVQPGTCRTAARPKSSTYLDNDPLATAAPTASQPIDRLSRTPRNLGAVHATRPQVGNETLRFGSGARRRASRCRCWRWERSDGGGYERAILGAHDADRMSSSARLRLLATEEVGRQYLEPNPHRADGCSPRRSGGALTGPREVRSGTP